MEIESQEKEWTSLIAGKTDQEHHTLIRAESKVHFQLGMYLAAFAMFLLVSAWLFIEFSDSKSSQIFPGNVQATFNLTTSSLNVDQVLGTSIRFLRSSIFTN